MIVRSDPWDYGMLRSNFNLTSVSQIRSGEICPSHRHLAGIGRIKTPGRCLLFLRAGLAVARLGGGENSVL